MRVAVTGGREYSNYDFIAKTLGLLHKGTSGPITLLIEGASDLTSKELAGTGADYWAHRWAMWTGVPNARMPAAWAHFKDRAAKNPAGPIRNGWILDTQNPHLLVAFPGGYGTADMIRQAEHRRIQVMRFDDQA